MRLKKQIDNLGALVNDRFDGIEEGLKRIIARGEIVSILKDELENAKLEKKELLDRLMSRDFESFKTYTVEGGSEEVGEDIKPEEDPDMAGEIFSVPKS